MIKKDLNGKIMTIEQKAKAYEEALERLKGLIEGTREDKCAIVEEDIIDIFPELAESEDERIRKALIQFFQRFPYDRLNDENLKPKEAIAWLEKQGEKKWTEEDEIGSDATIEILEYFNNYAPEFRKPTIRRSIDWLKNIKKRMEE